jgi:hypothetical protein
MKKVKEVKKIWESKAKFISINIWLLINVYIWLFDKKVIIIIIIYLKWLQI